MTTRTAIYARTSLDCPLSEDEQIERLRTIAADVDGQSQACSATDRQPCGRVRIVPPGELALLDAIRSGSIGKVLLWSVCRIGRTLADLVTFMETCRSAGVAVYLHEAANSIPRPRMDYRCSMSPRFSPTTCDNPVVTEYCGVWLRLAHCQLDLAGHRSRRPRHSEPNENWLPVRACDRLLEWQESPRPRSQESKLQ